jgi:lipoic acid synthetase
MISPSAPSWLLAEVRQAKTACASQTARETSHLLERLNLSTVCDSARCPNRGECFSHRTATFMILGETCTRGCAFCAVHPGRPQPPDEDEPDRLAQAVNELGLRHVVITSVTRDDLPDGGASHFFRVTRVLRSRCAGVAVELLVPDFQGSTDALAEVLSARPDILAHNIETVPRLYPPIRRGADYRRSLDVLRQCKAISPETVTKSGLMLGLGEQSDEVAAVLQDIRRTGCDMLTLGQYLSPSIGHTPVARYVAIEEFARWRQDALAIGFRSVASGPLVRSSYKAPAFFKELR